MLELLIFLPNFWPSATTSLLNCFLYYYPSLATYEM